MKAIGLMSGTSLDAIDAATVHVEKSDGRYSARLECFHSVPWDESLRARLLLACEDKATTGEIARLDVEVGRAFAHAARQVLARAGWRKEEVAVIGSHGQTIFHAGDEGVTLQVGDIASIAVETGIACVGNFRRHDLALGGQGAPLTPWADWHLLSSPTLHRIVHNIGGMANLTWLARGGCAEQVLAWDSGPGNVLLDECESLATNGASRFDWNGEGAARGRVDSAWLEGWQEHPFFARRPPKSCGREEFGRAFAAEFYDSGLNIGMSKDDVLANAARLSAWSMARSYAMLFDELAPGAEHEAGEVLLCGGGAFNPTLRRFVAEELRAQTTCAWPVRRLQEVGGDCEAREAVAFAMLACAAIEGKANTLAAVTGARRATVAGQIARP
jgi:anhydro-N-acetylmuramic acid kinase